MYPLTRCSIRSMIGVAIRLGRRVAGCSRVLMSCSCQDLIRLHVLALDTYDAVAYYVRDLVG